MKFKELVEYLLNTQSEILLNEEANLPSVGIFYYFDDFNYTCKDCVDERYNNQKEK